MDSAIQNISSILNLGFDINAITLEGKTCLGLFSQRLGYFWESRRETALREQQALVFLLQNGANPHLALEGLPVFQELYRCHCFGFCKRNGVWNHGSYCGDIWDSALSICGKDIPEFRAGYQRRAEYTECYTREIFEALWMGRENACPYWDDKPWPRPALGHAETTSCIRCGDSTLHTSEDVY